MSKKHNPSFDTSKAAFTAETPNAYPKPFSDEHFAELATTCKFLGRTYQNGDEVCYHDQWWRCQGGTWQPTGEECKSD